MAEWGYMEENDVVSLTKATHDQFLDDYEFAVITYMSPTCHVCKNMKDWFHDLGLYFKEYKIRTPIAMIDCNNYPEYCRKFNIPVFPEMRLYIKKHPLSYHGERNRESFQKWIEHRLSHVPDKLSTVQDIYKLRVRRSAQ